MSTSNPSRSHLICWFLFFGMSTVIAILMLLLAAFVWLSAWTGSFIVSALILGVFFAVLAIVIYLSAIRDALERIRIQAETIYEVARLAQSGYQWVVGKVLLFLRLRDLLHSK